VSGKIVFRFHSSDLHMVLGPSKSGTPVRFKVKVNVSRRRRSWIRFRGRWHRRGSTTPDVSARPQKGPIKDAILEIEFLDPGVEAFSFTFG